VEAKPAPVEYHDLHPSFASPLSNKATNAISASCISCAVRSQFWLDARGRSKCMALRVVDDLREDVPV
jgi:hypothetical protein